MRDMPNQTMSDRETYFLRGLYYNPRKKYFFRSEAVWFGYISRYKNYVLALQFPQLGVSFRIRWLLNTLLLAMGAGYRGKL